MTIVGTILSKFFVCNGLSYLMNDLTSAYFYMPVTILSTIYALSFNPSNSLMWLLFLFYR